MFATSNTLITTTNQTSSISSSSFSLSSGQTNLANVSNTKKKVLNNGSNKYLLTQGINILSTNVQKEGLTGDNNSVYLKLENEALEHIEYLVLEVLDSIILASSNLNEHSPEQTCALIMSNSSSQQVLFYPITNLDEAEMRVKQILPRSYSEDACARAFKKVEKCKSILNSSKKNRFLFKVMNTASTNPLSVLSSQQITSSSSDSNNNLTCIFSFPLEKIHNLLVETYQSPKLDVQVTIFLVAILEHITKDILRLSSSYSRHLNQYIINKKDVNISIEGDSKLKKLFFSTSIPQNNNLIFDDSETSDINDEFDDDEFSHVAYVLGPFDPVGPNFFFPNRSNIRQSTISIASLPGLTSSNDSTISPSNPDECTSDSSTICPESITYENFNLMYYLKVKEFMSELQEHLTDLEILRHIFMHLFLRYGPDQECIDAIFGNINDVYDCALRLSELLDDAISSQQNTKQEQESLNQPLLVGQQFWELAEGAEFHVYQTFANTVTNYSNLKSNLQKLFNDSYFCKNLQSSAPGLVEIGKYLLPKLLLGSVYYFLYLNETINTLQQLSFNEDDRTFLNDTLDTLKPVLYNLKDKDFSSSKKRPIETSFRIFQPNQFQPIERQNQLMNSSVSIGQTSVVSTGTSKVPALAHNICLLNEKKWKEIESTIESLKLPSHINQIISSNQNSSMSKGTNSTCSNLRYAYLYEGGIQICKTSQQIQPNNCDLKSHVLSQSKLRVSKRYAYLFDGLLVFAKKHQTSPLIATNLGSNTKPYRFKESIELDKFTLRDRDDENCFELHLISQSSHDFDLTISSQSQSDKADQEFILFIADSPSDKYTWMSMLCYSFYKLKIDGLLRDMTNEHKKNNPLPIPPSGYIFDQADSPETIIFEKPSLQSNSYYSSDGLFIKAATLVKLVERLTHHRYIHHKFSATFLMFYRKFTTPRDFLDLLSRRFDVPDLNLDEVKDKYNFNSGTITERELLKRYKREYQQPIKLKVINLIKHWLEGYFNDDFAEDSDLLESLMQLIEKIGKSYKRFEHVLTKTVQKKKTQYQEQVTVKQMNDDVFAKQSEIDLSNLKNIFKKKISSSSSSNTSLSNVSSRSSSTSTNEDLSSDQDINDLVYPPFETHLETTHPYDILTIHPLEFARQATLMEEKLFKAIKPNELISLGWNKPDQKFKLSPNVSKLITLSNKFTYWYAKCIVDTQNLEERIAVVHRLLDIASYFYELNNFSGLKEIYAAFEASFTTRLAITREKSGLEQHRMYEIFKKLFDDHDKGYFERLKKCSPPCIPFIGFHLSIIMKTHEWNKMNVQKQNECITEDQKKLSSSSDGKFDTSESNLSDSSCEALPNLINFSKYRLLVEFVNDLLQYQSVSYKYRINNNIRAYLLEDIENYFETARQELDSTSGTPDHSEAKKIEDKVDTLLYNKSRQIEPNDIEFPRIRNYALKSPPICYIGKSTNNVSKLNESHRSQSATRIEKKNNQLNTSKQFMAPVYKNTLSKNTGLNSQKNSKAINTSATSYCINREDKSSNLVYKRSNSSNYNNFKPSDESISTIFTSSTSPLNNAKNPSFSHSKSASSSSSFQLSHNFEQTNTHGQKLSLSSADSSSSAPNSPPPNYEDVFDSANAVSNYPLITNPAILNCHREKKCFDNKTYFHKSSSSSPSLNNETKLNGSNSKNENKNQNLVFSFPDFGDCSETSLKNSIDGVSPIFPMTPSYNRSKVLPPAPTQRPPSPPNQPPLVIRSTLSTGFQHTSSNQLSMPPPIPPRPAKKT